MSEIYNSPRFLKSRIVVDFFLRWSEIYMDLRKFEIYNCHRYLKSITFVDYFSEIERNDEFH